MSEIVRTTSTTVTTDIIGGKATTKAKTIEYVKVRSIRSDRIDVSVVGLFVRALEQAQAPGNAKISAHRSDVGHLIQLTAEWQHEIAESEPAEATQDDSGGQPDTVTFHASDYADKLTFSATPAWLTAALEAGIVKGVFKGEDYWYLEVRTLAGVVTAEPGDTIGRHYDGGLIVRSPEGLCKKTAPYEI